MALAAAYAAVWPLVSVLRVRPRPTPALALAVTNFAALAYVLASGFLRLPGGLFGLVLAMLCLWTLIIAYRGIISPGMFARNGGPGERWKMIREAKRSSRAEIEALYPPKYGRHGVTVSAFESASEFSPRPSPRLELQFLMARCIAAQRRLS